MPVCRFAEKLPRKDRKECWATIRRRLNEEERKLFEVEEIRYDLIIALALPLFTAMTISNGINSITELLGDDSNYILLGSLLFLIVVVIMFCIVGYNYNLIKHTKAALTD